VIPTDAQAGWPAQGFALLMSDAVGLIRSDLKGQSCYLAEEFVQMCANQGLISPHIAADTFPRPDL
jgi:hypothetical protein